MKIIDSNLVDSLNLKAIASDRKRAHYNLHSALDDKIHRLCVAIEPGSYIRPHRHPETDKWEMFIVLQGAAVMLTFDDEGLVTDKVTLSDNGPIKAVEVPCNTWHTLASLEKRTMLMEIKPGPYSPLAERDFASWAPQEGASDAKRFEELFRTTYTGTKIIDHVNKNQTQL